MNAPRHRIPIRLPAPVALAFIAAVAVCIGYMWPALLTTKIREKLRGPPLYIVSFGFALATLGFAAYLCAMLLPDTDHRIVYRTAFGQTTLYVVPALLAWGASAFAWAGVGALGSVVAVVSALAWGLKPMYAGWSRSTDFWSGDNPSFYGAGLGLAAVAIVLVVYQVATLRSRGAGAVAVAGAR